MRELSHGGWCGFVGAKHVLRQPLAIEVWHDDEEDRCYSCLSNFMIVACSTTITVGNGG